MSEEDLEGLTVDEIWDKATEANWGNGPDPDRVLTLDALKQYREYMLEDQEPHPYHLDVEFTKEQLFEIICQFYVNNGHRKQDARNRTKHFFKWKMKPRFTWEQAFFWCKLY